MSANGVRGVLIDENMPERLPLPSNVSSIHSTALGNSLSDRFIWDHAKANALAIITKDSDFTDLVMLSTPPPWVVRFRIGNMRRLALLALVAKVWPQIEQLLPAHKLINVYHDRIEAIT